jgi:SAM-dependent methyltransferase
MTQNVPSANFNRIARPYRYLEYLALGPILQRTRTHFLPHLLDRKHALIFGDGDGRFLARLLAGNAILDAVAVDISSGMLKLLRGRCSHAASRLRTINENALRVIPTPEKDLIVTHFFLDCLDQRDVNTLVANIAHPVSPGTLWLISDFRIPSGPMRLPARLYIRALYLAFRLFTGLRTTRLPDYETPLKNAGFTRINQHLALLGLLTTELWTKQQPVTVLCDRS